MCIRDSVKKEFLKFYEKVETLDQLVDDIDVDTTSYNQTTWSHVLTSFPLFKKKLALTFRKILSCQFASSMPSLQYMNAQQSSSTQYSYISINVYLIANPIFSQACLLYTSPSPRDQA
eukprot:TRINITY_DN7553_c0_g1_i5.p1 TRINITY_DN7553_c0_g1~~TRINITY_DN7553_c0_g1_i5.p1  ORF type:complete len:118 (-),score=2.13 TRINITY_DN7553_c0_g1_i5:67-420(-)